MGIFDTIGDVVDTVTGGGGGGGSSGGGDSGGSDSGSSDSGGGSASGGTGSAVGGGYGGGGGGSSGGGDSGGSDSGGGGSSGGTGSAVGGGYGGGGGGGDGGGGDGGDSDTFTRGGDGRSEPGGEPALGGGDGGGGDGGDSDTFTRGGDGRSDPGGNTTTGLDDSGSDGDSSAPNIQDETTNTVGNNDPDDVFNATEIDSETEQTLLNQTGQDPQNATISQVIVGETPETNTTGTNITETQRQQLKEQAAANDEFRDAEDFTITDTEVTEDGQVRAEFDAAPLRVETEREGEALDNAIEEGVEQLDQQTPTREVERDDVEVTRTNDGLQFEIEDDADLERTDRQVEINQQQFGKFSGTADNTRQTPGSDPAEAIDTEFVDEQTDSGGIFAETPSDTSAVLPGSVFGIDISEQQLDDLAAAGEDAGDQIADSGSGGRQMPRGTVGSPLNSVFGREVADAGGRAVEALAAAPGQIESGVEFAQNAPLTTKSAATVGATATATAKGLAKSAVTDPVDFAADAGVGVVTGTAATRGARAVSRVSAPDVSNRLKVDEFRSGPNRGQVPGGRDGANAVDDGDGLLLEKTETVDETETLDAADETTARIEEPGEDPTLDELQQAAELAEERQQSDVEFEQQSRLARKREQERQQLGLTDDDQLQQLEQELQTQQQTAAAPATGSPGRSATAASIFASDGQTDLSTTAGTTSAGLGLGTTATTTTGQQSARSVGLLADQTADLDAGQTTQTGLTTGLQTALTTGLTTTTTTTTPRGTARPPRSWRINPPSDDPADDSDPFSGDEERYTAEGLDFSI